MFRSAIYANSIGASKPEPATALLSLSHPTACSGVGRWGRGGKPPRVPQAILQSEVSLWQTGAKSDKIM